MKHCAPKVPPQPFKAGESHALELLATGADLETVLSVLIRAIEQQCPGVIGSVLLLDSQKCMRHGAAPNLPNAYIEAIDGLPIGPNVGSCGTAMHSGQLVIVEDITVDPSWTARREIAQQHNLRACWSQPVFSSTGEVLGSFAMYYRDARRPSGEEIRLIRSAAHLTGIAIERTQADASLREREQRFRATFENAAVGIAHLAPDGRVLRVNQRLSQIAGYSCEQLLAMTLSSITHPEDTQANEDQLRRLLSGEMDSLSMEKRYIRSDDQIVWVNLTCSTVREADGAIAYIICIIEDISERKLAEQQLHETAETLEHKVIQRTAEAEARASQLRALAAELINAEERERRRVAQILHDGLQQLLVASKMQLAMVVSRLGGSELVGPIQQARELIDASIGESRSLTSELSPPVLYDAGLAPALEWLGRWMEETHGLSVEVDAAPNAEPASQE
ncbi:MAG: PAS domain S-box protein, partial [Phycisphaeraceae bacterium]